MDRLVKGGKNKSTAGTHSSFLKDTGVESRFLDCVAFLYRKSVLDRQNSLNSPQINSSQTRVADY